MITDRIARHEVLVPINHNYNKIFDNFFFQLKQNKLRHDAYCPIGAEIRTVDHDSQSDLRILF